MDDETNETERDEDRLASLKAEAKLGWIAFPFEVLWLLDRLRTAEARADRLEDLLAGSHTREIDHLNRAFAAEARAAEAEAVIAEALRAIGDAEEFSRLREILTTAPPAVLARVKAEVLEEAVAMFESREFNGFQYVARTKGQVQDAIRSRAKFYRAGAGQ